jgi:stage IV sporulation protein FB
MKKHLLKIKLSFSGAIMLLALFLTHSYVSIAALIAAALHELGHIIAAKLCDIPLGELRLGIFGAALTPKTMLCSYKKEMLLCLAGPLTNIMLSLFLLPLYNTNTFFALFIKASLFLGILNLLPIYEFDGGRILFCILSYKLPPRTSITVIRVISFILIFALWSLSVYLLLRLSSSISLFIFSLSLFSKIFLSQRENLY